MATEVLCRNVFSVSIIWAEETTRYLTLAGVFLLVGPLLKDGSHIKVVFVYTLLPAKSQRIIDSFMSILGVVICCFCALSSKNFIDLLVDVEARSISGTPFHPWTWQLPVIIGFVLGAVFFCADFFKNIRENRV